MDEIWHKQYPTGVPAEVQADLYPSLVALFDGSMRKHRNLPALRIMGRDISFGQLDDLSQALAAYLQSQGLVGGDRVAVMLANDRKKDMILVGGFDVSPNEIEDIVAQLPGVLACAAVGVPDARAGEAVKLIVVKADPASASPSEADIRAWCDARLTGYKRQRIVEFRADLQRTPVGKVLRRALRDAA